TAAARSFWVACGRAAAVPGRLGGAAARLARRRRPERRDPDVPEERSGRGRVRQGPGPGVEQALRPRRHGTPTRPVEECGEGRTTRPSPASPRKAFEASANRPATHGACRRPAVAPVGDTGPFDIYPYHLEISWAMVTSESQSTPIPTRGSRTPIRP